MTFIRLHNGKTKSEKVRFLNANNKSCELFRMLYDNLTNKVAVICIYYKRSEI